MKKIYLLFVAATLAACSAEPVENEVSGLDANLQGKSDRVSTQETVEEYLEYPQTICVGEEGTFTFIFNGKRNGNTNLKLDIWADDLSTEEVDWDWQEIDHIQSSGEGEKEVEVKYIFEKIGSYTLRYQIGGSPIEFSVDVITCESVCTYAKGYWKNHSNDNPGGQGDVWPVMELTLGNQIYDRKELNTIMDVPNNEGNNLVIFSQHLIAAKLNVANGAKNIEIEATIAEADQLIGNLVVLEDSFSDEQKKTANALKGVLESFNKSTPCDDTSEE